jgi:hypothetical protein
LRKELKKKPSNPLSKGGNNKLSLKKGFKGKKKTEKPIISLSYKGAREALPPQRIFNSRISRGVPFKHMYAIDLNNLLILGSFDPNLALNLSPKRDYLSANDVDRIVKSLKMFFRASNCELVSVLEEVKMPEFVMSEDGCQNTPVGDCDGGPVAQDCDNDADTCDKGDSCCKKNNQ